MDHLPAHEIFDRHALEYQARFMDVGPYHASFDKFCQHLPMQAEILELACGPGNITRYLLQQRPDFRILATDLAPAMVALARSNNPAAECALLDCRSLGTIKRRFDGLMIGFALPYLSQEETRQLIEDGAALLRPGGLLYLSTMEGEPSNSGLQTNSHGEQVQMHFHSEATLVPVLEQHGLSLLSIARVSGPPPAQVVDLILIGGKAR